MVKVPPGIARLGSYNSLNKCIYTVLRRLLPVSAHYLKDKGPYIVKPIASSRGRGIFLVNHVSRWTLVINIQEG